MSLTFQGKRFFQNAVSSRSQINKIDKVWKRLNEKFQHVSNLENSQFVPSMIERFSKTRNSLFLSSKKKRTAGFLI